MSVTPVSLIAALPSLEGVSPLTAQLPAASAGTGSFSELLTNGADGVSSKFLDADAMVRAFAVDDSIPVHQVTYALERARLSLELMMQVRGRLVEAYQQLMNMQL